MNEEKQIEEMAYEIETRTGYLKSTCYISAETLYNAGYRKQSEGEWVLEHETYGKMICSNCKEEAPIKYAYNETKKTHLEYAKKPYCPECGAKMKGV